MMIVDPDEVARFVTLDYFVCKNTIRFDVRFPAFRVKSQLRREIVKHGPEGLIGIAFVESGGYLLRQVNRETSFFLRPHLFSFPLLSFPLRRHPDPFRRRHRLRPSGHVPEALWNPWVLRVSSGSFAFLALCQSWSESRPWS